MRSVREFGVDKKDMKYIHGQTEVFNLGEMKILYKLFWITAN